MPRATPLDNVSVPEMSWDVAAAIGGFKLDTHATANLVTNAHKVAIGKSRTHGPVAVKAHTRKGKAEYEAQKLEEIAGKGIMAFKPLVVAPGAIATYLVMERAPKLTHLGQLNWARTIADPQTTKTLLPRLESAAQDVASLHNAGIVHRDLHPGNMMYQNGDFIAGDVEGAEIDTIGKQRTKGEASDLYKLGASLLLRQGFLGDRSSAFRAAALGDHLYEPYAEERTTDPAVSARDMREAWDYAVINRRLKPPSDLGG